MAYPGIVQVRNKTSASSFFKEMAEGRFGHGYNL
jgi:hypothetical protein